jgi:hypothetical protein
VLDRATGVAFLAKLDAFAAELARFRAEIIALMPPAAANGADVDGADDFAEHNMVGDEASSGDRREVA